MNKNAKTLNPMKVITGPDTCWSYANVWEPKSINGGTPKYSVSLIIPKSDTKTVAKIKQLLKRLTKKEKANLKETENLFLLFLSSRRHFAMVILKDLTIPLMPMRIL